VCTGGHVGAEHLASLALGSNNVGAEGARALALALRVNTTLTALHLGGNDIGTDGVRALAIPLAENSTPTAIGLGQRHRCRWGTRARGGLGEEHHSHISQLERQRPQRCTSVGAEEEHTLTYLSSNCISVGGAFAIAVALGRNSALTCVNFENNNLGADGAHALASIDMAANGIGVDGVRAIAAALQENTSLTAIDLADEGACAVAEALERNTTLTSIGLWINNIGNAGVAAFQIALASNLTLRELSGVSGVDDILARYKSVMHTRKLKARHQRCVFVVALTESATVFTSQFSCLE
jgi:hypothetical protein